jgi:hypothetical protein
MVTLARRNSEELSPLREEGKLANFFRSNTHWSCRDIDP